MARPKQEHPTPAELEVLKILWERGPATVRQVMETLESRHNRRAYTSVMSLMNVMNEKGLLRRRPNGRAFLYSARARQQKTLGEMVEDLRRRAFEGSASTLVAQLLEEASPDGEELEQIRRAIDAYQRQQESR